MKEEDLTETMPHTITKGIPATERESPKYFSITIVVIAYAYSYLRNFKVDYFFNCNY